MSAAVRPPMSKTLKFFAVLPAALVILPLLAFALGVKVPFALLMN